MIQMLSKQKVITDFLNGIFDEEKPQHKEYGNWCVDHPTIFKPNNYAEERVEEEPFASNVEHETTWD